MSSETQAILSLVAASHGHFRLESGHHSRLWYDLERLFVEPVRVAPLVNDLAQAIQPHDVAAVCGPLVGGAFVAQMLASTLQVEFCFTERVRPPGHEGLYGAEYRLPRGLREGVRGKRVAIVDDVISAGSAVRSTHAELTAHGAHPVVVGALLVLGSLASPFFAQEGIPLASVAQLSFDLWLPAECPLCVSGLPIVNGGEVR